MLSPKWNTIFIFIFISLALSYYKPLWCFDKNGHMKEFGIGKNKTCFSFAVVVAIVTIIAYFLSVTISQLITT